MVMRETLEGFKGGIKIGGRNISNLRYADDIILLSARTVMVKFELNSRMISLRRVDHRGPLRLSLIPLSLPQVSLATGLGPPLDIDL